MSLSFPFYHHTIDEFLNKEQAIKISQEFPEYNSNYWFSYNNPLENKKSCNNWYAFGPETYKTFAYLNSPEFISKLQEITGIEKLYPDIGLSLATQSKCEVFTFSCRVHNFLNIKSTIQRLRPKIIIMLSDEFYQDNHSIYNELGNECELFLRQYHHSGYNYTSNTLHIPLGYTNGCKVFEENKNLKWSFFGLIKEDRAEMISEFRQLTPYMIGNSLSKELMCKVYSQSTFVPCGRGNSSLDCFRLYEASMNGAIPIVVGKKKEIETTFKYEDNPPWIFAETWSEALNHLDTEINSENVKKWWSNRILKIKNKVQEVL